MNHSKPMDRKTKQNKKHEWEKGICRQGKKLMGGGRNRGEWGLIELGRTEVRAGDRLIRMHYIPASDSQRTNLISKKEF